MATGGVFSASTLVCEDKPKMAPDVGSVSSCNPLLLRDPPDKSEIQVAGGLDGVSLENRLNRELNGGLNGELNGLFEYSYRANVIFVGKRS